MKRFVTIFRRNEAQNIKVVRPTALSISKRWFIERSGVWARKSKKRRTSGSHFNGTYAWTSLRTSNIDWKCQSCVINCLNSSRGEWKSTCNYFVLRARALLYSPVCIVSLDLIHFDLCWLKYHRLSYRPIVLPHVIYKSFSYLFVFFWWLVFFFSYHQMFVEK